MGDATLCAPAALHSPAWRHLLLGLALAPIAGGMLRAAPALAALAPAAAPTQMTVEQIVAGATTADKLSPAVRIECSSAGIRLFDAAGRLRVVFDCFDQSP